MTGFLTALANVLVIARLTLLEALRRRILRALIVLTVVIVVLTGLGFGAIVDNVDWTVRDHERWVVLGRNGSGKTTLLRIASCYLHPTAGTVDVLGHRLGRVDVRELRTRIGLSSAALADQLRAGLDAVDVVMTAKYAALEPWWHTYDDSDRQRALVPPRPSQRRPNALTPPRLMLHQIGPPDVELLRGEVLRLDQLLDRPHLPSRRR